MTKTPITFSDRRLPFCIIETSEHSMAHLMISSQDAEHHLTLRYILTNFILLLGPSIRKPSTVTQNLHQTVWLYMIRSCMAIKCVFSQYMSQWKTTMYVFRRKGAWHCTDNQGRDYFEKTACNTIKSPWETSHQVSACHSWRRKTCCSPNESDPDKRLNNPFSYLRLGKL